MKPKLFLMTLSLSLIITAFSQGVVNNGGRIVVTDGSVVVIDGNFTNSGDGNVLNSGIMSVSGDWTNIATSGNLLQGTSGLVKFTGSTTQFINGTSKTWFNQILLEKDIILNYSISVSDELEFDGASLYLNHYNGYLYMEPDAIISGVDPTTSFVVTNYTGGALVREVGSIPVEFPVGTVGSYSPITMVNNGISDTYSVSVFSDVLVYGNGGGTIPEIDDCVNKTWLAYEENSGGSNLDIEVHWNSGDEGNSFSRSNSAIGYYSGGWIPDFANPALGTDPYTQSRTGITDPGSFAVGDYESYMAITAVINIETDIMVYLEGPFNGTDMDTHLNGNPALVEGLPLSQPYNTAPWNYNGTESVPSIPNPDIVDWVLVEFRDATDAANATDATTIQQQAAFLLSDGSVVDLDGNSNIQFTTTLSQQLYVVIRHRNHIDIISSNPLTDAGGLYSYNFTSAIDKVYGGALGYKDIASGVYGMAGGDSDASGSVGGTDKTLWTAESGKTGYLNEDQNMDGQVNNKDKNDVWISNNNIKSSQVPE